MVRLRGKNQIENFRQVAERLVSRISPLEGVVGIVFLGGLVRGFADKFSDVDLIVFLSKKDDELKRHIRKIGLDEEQRSGLDVDLEIHFLADFRKWRLDEIVMWDFSKAEIVFDPKEEISKLLSSKLRVSEHFWLRRIAVGAEYVKWYCCPPRENIGTISEAWIDRGGLVSAHYCLNYVIDLVLGIVFALNREFLPAQKWRVFYSYNLSWLPRDYRRLIEEAMTVKSLSEHDLKRRIRVLRKLWRDIAPKIEQETGLTLDSLSKYFVEIELHQT